MALSSVTANRLRQMMLSFYKSFDPTYNGLSAVGSLPIIGLEEYKYDRQIMRKSRPIKIQAEELPDSYVKEYYGDGKADVAYSKEDIAAILDRSGPSMSEEAMTDFSSTHMN